MTHSKTITLACALLVAALPQLGHAQQGMPLDYFEFYYQPGQQMDPMYKATGTHRMTENDRNMATYRSRVEAEGKVEIARKDLGKATAQLDKLANDPKLAAKVFGKGWRVTKVGTWDFSDVYRDNATYDLAKAHAGFRVRTVNGGKAEVNVKPPGARKSRLGNGRTIVDTHDGVITRRVEYGTSMHAKASIRTIAGTKSKLNPLGWIAKMMKQNPTKFVAPAINIHQDRTRYVLEKLEKDGQWSPLVDLSVDDITATLASGRTAKRKKVKFASIEMDLNHPGSGTGLVIEGTKWKPPHSPRDLRRTAFMQDGAVRDLHQAVPKLLDFIGVQATSAAPKYTAAAVKLGLITERQPRARKTLSTGEQKSVTRFLKSQGWTTNASIRVIGQSRSGNSWRVLVENNHGGGTHKLYMHKKTGEVFVAAKPAKQAQTGQKNSVFSQRRLLRRQGLRGLRNSSFGRTSSLLRQRMLRAYRR